MFSSVKIADEVEVYAFTLKETFSKNTYLSPPWDYEYLPPSN